MAPGRRGGVADNGSLLAAAHGSADLKTTDEQRLHGHAGRPHHPDQPNSTRRSGRPKCAWKMVPSTEDVVQVTRANEMASWMSKAW
jgi:hypothetical protein